MEANARLIAAAPELLEALKAFAYRFAGYLQTDDDLWSTVRAAIAKAEGK